MRLLVLALALAVTAASAGAERVLRVVGDENSPPFLFRGADGQTKGYIVDWWALWSRTTGTAVDLRAMPWASAQAALLRGDVDVIENMYRTPDREAHFDFSAPYASMPVNIYVHSAISGVQDLAGLRGFPIAAMEADACVEFLRRHDLTDLRLFPNYSALIAHALKDDVRVFCLDEIPADYYLTRAGAQKIFRKAFPVFEGQLHRAVRKGDVDTLRLVEAGTALIPAHQDVALREKWMPAPEPERMPRLAVAAALLLALSLVLLFTLGAAMRQVRQRSRALREERARLAMLFRALPDPAWMRDPDGVYLACNEALERALGAAPGSVVGKTDRALLPPHIVQLFRSADAEALSSSKPVQNETWFELPGLRAPRLFAASTRGLLDDDGNAIGTVGVARDITEQYLLEQALQDRLKELRCLYSVFTTTEEPARPLNEVVRDVAHQLPSGFRRGETAESSVELGGASYATAARAPEAPALVVPVCVDASRRGEIAVWYPRPMPADDPPFIEEERRLLDAVARRLAFFLRGKEAAEHAERARRFTERIIDIANVMVLGLDAEGCVLFLNAKGEALLGFSERELLGCDWFATVLGRETDRSSRAAFDRIAETGELVKAFENTVWTKAGEPRRILWSHSTLDDPDDRRITVSFGFDVTEQRAIEHEIARHRDNLEQLVAERTESLRRAMEERHAMYDTASAGIVLMRDRQVVRCNRAFEQILGYGPGELEGRTSRVWFADDETFRDVGRRFEAAMANGSVHREEHEVVRKDGSRVWCSLSARLVDPTDPSLGVAGVIADISLEREARLEVERARLAAEEAARAKADFLANMSHEIRTPMNAIIGMSHLIARSGLTPTQRDYLSKIQRAGEHLLGVIDDILDFSKAEAGKIELDVGEFELERMIANVTSLVGGTASAKGIELIVDIGPDVPLVLSGDELRIRQVLLNFCSNAVKFTDRGEIGLKVRQLARDDDGALLEFAVRDSGIGLDAAARARLFRSFQQADSSTSRKYGGTGLGLAISKRLVELMQGEIGVDSAPGEGSTFWFRVRLGLGRRAPRPMILAPELRGLRMLVVDDNATARAVLRDMLSRMGFVIDEAASGEAALECVRQAAGADAAYEIVFLDWRMPGVDGVEIANRIRGLGLERAPRCVMTTAYGGEGMVTAAKGTGVVATLVKPVNASVLFDTLTELLARRAESAGQAELSPRGDSPHEELAAVRGARVLLVEDNDLNQEVARALLSSVGLVVDVAENGEVALHKVQEASYDLVFMDMQMPVMDGLTATREIRRLTGGGLLPIVAMTANVLEQDRERCLEAGMNDYLGKPIVPSMLWTCLKRWIRPGRRPPQATGQSTAPPVGPVATMPLEVEGLDAESGLRRVAGNLRFYLSLLGRFAERNRRITADIDRLLQEGDHAGAQHLAHALKGAAGTLGAVRVQAAAGELESVLHLEPDSRDLANRLAALGAELVALFAALERQLPGALASAGAASTSSGDQGAHASEA